MAKTPSIIRKVYIYLVTAITIVILLIGFIGLINLLLKEYVFDVKGWQEVEKYWECDKPGGEFMLREVPEVVSETKDVIVDVEEAMTDKEKEDCIAEAKKQRDMQHMNDLKRDLAQYLAMIIVAFPLYLYHWGLVKKEK